MIRNIVFLILMILLVGFSVFSITVPIYRYNFDTNRWERVVTASIVNIDTFSGNKSKTILSSTAPNATSLISEPESYSGNSNMSIPLNNSITTIPSPSLSANQQWYYSITYTIGSSNASNKKAYTLWAGQNIDCGIVYVWNDDSNLYVKYVTNHWIMTETHVKVQTSKPIGNQAPGLFPYKSEYSEPVEESLYMIPLSDDFKSAGKLYILAHAVVFKSNVRNSEETAWAGDAPNCMEVEISGSKVAWFIKKPGRYFSNVLKMTVKSDLPVVVTFSGFSDPKAEDDATLGVFYSITKNITPQAWLTSDQINGFYVNLSDNPGILYVWQMIKLNYQSSNTYRNEGVITFTLKNVKSYNEVP